MLKRAAYAALFFWLQLVYFIGMHKIFSVLAFVLLVFPFPAKATENVPASAAQMELSFAPVVRKVAPAVVNIYTRRMVTQQAINPFAGDPFFSQFFGHQYGLGVPRQRLESSLGSGVIVDGAGLVVTNAHVVKNSAETKVVLADGREFDAKIAIADEAADIALLRIDTKGEKLPAAALQSSETLEVGDLVIAIGNPFGVGQTVTSGIISALARSSLDISDFNFFIQTDAAINPGNSGGPLVAMSGGVIGINSAIYSKDGGSLGIGFAVPSEMVATIIAAEQAGQIDGKNGIKRPWAGVTAQDVTADIAISLGMASPFGALVADLHEASPLRDAGLRQGDVVTAVNGRPVRDAAEFRFRLATVPLGKTADIGYLRNGERKETVIQTILPPDKPDRQTTTLKGTHPLAGITVANLNPALASELGLRIDEGVVITALRKGLQVAAVLRRGDVIAGINGRKISNVDDLLSVLGKPASAWQFDILQNGQLRQLVVR